MTLQTLRTKAIVAAMTISTAVMASPFISTIVDALSLLVYFMFAKMLLNI